MTEHLTNTERIILDARYGRRDDYTVRHRFTVPHPDPTPDTFVLVVEFNHDGNRGHGFDVWVGPSDGIHNQGNGGALEDGALWYASTFAPEARPRYAGIGST